MTLTIRARVPGRLDVALQIAAGETVALLGANGAGKSTLLAVVAGLQQADGGVALDGRELGTLPPHRRGVALLAQDPLLFPQLTALENVAFGPRAHGVRRRRARARASELLRQVGVEDLAGRRPHHPLQQRQEPQLLVRARDGRVDEHQAGHLRVLLGQVQGERAAHRQPADHDRVTPPGELVVRALGLAGPVGPAGADHVLPRGAVPGESRHLDREEFEWLHAELTRPMTLADPNMGPKRRIAHKLEELR